MMIGCNPNFLEILLGAVGGIAIVKYVTDYIKKQLHAKGLWAYLISLGLCAVASGGFVLFIGEVFVLKCFLFYVASLFVLANFGYRLDKLLKKDSKDAD